MYVCVAFLFVYRVTSRRAIENEQALVPSPSNNTSPGTIVQNKMHEQMHGVSLTRLWRGPASLSAKHIQRRREQALHSGLLFSRARASQLLSP